MLYEFIDTDSGKLVELEFRMMDAPSIGDTIRRDGRNLRRLVPSLSPEIRREFKPYVAISKPKGMPGCPVDKKTGRSVITSREMERNVARQRGEEWL